MNTTSDFTTKEKKTLRIKPMCDLRFGTGTPCKNMSRGFAKVGDMKIYLCRKHLHMVAMKEITDSDLRLIYRTKQQKK